jgi:hypothetical protein
MREALGFMNYYAFLLTFAQAAETKHLFIDCPPLSHSFPCDSTASSNMTEIVDAEGGVAHVTR